jgi:hypothetical protein
MTSGTITTALLRRLAAARAEVLPSGLQLAAALGNGQAAAAQAADLEQRAAVEQLRRDRFYADARWLGVTPETADRILALADSDQVRHGHLMDPWDFAHAVLAVVQPSQTVPDN